MTTSVRRGFLPAIALVTLLAAERGAIAGDESCPPTALVTGEPTLVEAVLTSLERRGIALEAAPDCPAVAVRIDRTATGLRVSIRDPDGRRSERVVSDADTAAALVESWARPELGAPSHARPAAATVTARARDPETPATLQPVIVYAAQPRPIAVAATTTASVASDGSAWLGLDAGACVQIGPVCAGAMVRTRLDSEVVGASERQETSRLGVDLLLTADRPSLWGRTRLRPGIGAGVGWLRSRSNPDGATPGQRVEFDAGGLRLDAHLAVSFPIRRHVSLELDLSVDVSLLAHTAPYQDEGVTLAGEPRGFLRGGIGLRYEAR